MKAPSNAQLQRDLLVRRLGVIGMWLSPIISYFFLWAPILVLIIFSFNDSNSISVWRGFTTKWFTNIFTNSITAGTEAARFQTQLLLKSVVNSLFVAFSATIISSIIGTMVAMALVRGRFLGKRVLDAVLYLPVVIPDITQGVALAVFFRMLFEFYQTLTGQRLVSGFATIIIAHVAFNISYVAIVVRSRLVTMDSKARRSC
ncbi:MAG: hypothetical protein R2880_03890 [Deinococcales bacterium]